MRQSHHASVFSAVLLAVAGCGTTPPPSTGQSSTVEIFGKPFPTSPQVEARAVAGKRVAELARAQLGAPYRYGGADPRGFDCSGLVHFVFAQLEINAPRTAAELQRAAQAVLLDSLQPGDLVFYRATAAATDHVGIYIGDGQFVHAPRSGRFVELRRLDDPWYAQRYAGAGRLIVPQ